MLKLTYDPDVDALYVQLKDTPPTDSVDYAAGLTLEFDADGDVVGVEILDASQRLDADAVTQLAAAQRAAVR
jgi:uncharacterized protein YuzE